MKKVLRFITLVLGLFSVLLFCVSATAGISNATGVEVVESLSEPLNLLFVGFALISFGSILRRRSIR